MCFSSLQSCAPPPLCAMCFWGYLLVAHLAIVGSIAWHSEQWICRPYDDEALDLKLWNWLQIQFLWHSISFQNYFCLYFRNNRKHARVSFVMLRIIFFFHSLGITLDSPDLQMRGSSTFAEIVRGLTEKVSREAIKRSNFTPFNYIDDADNFISVWRNNSYSYTTVIRYINQEK